MTSGQASEGSQQYIVFGDGVINKDGQVNYAKGSGNLQSNVSVTPVTDSRDLWEQLAQELARIHEVLERNLAVSADRNDAIEVVTDLETDLPDLRRSGPDSRRRLRQRVKAVIGVLAPVAEIIGGFAALEAICRHLYL